MTVIEIMVASSLLIIGVGALSSSILSGSRLSSSKKDSGRAHNAARMMLESLQGQTFSEVYARCNANPLDDPDGVGTAAGPNFAVRGLTPLVADADGFVGSIEFPDLDLGAGNLVLREDTVDAAFGMPRDLNSDGVVDALDHSGDYTLLPVRLTLQWRGSSINRRLVLELLLTSR